MVFIHIHVIWGIVEGDRGWVSFKLRLALEAFKLGLAQGEGLAHICSRPRVADAGW